MKVSWRAGASIVLLWAVMVLAPSCALAAEAVGGLGDGGLGSSLLEPVGGGRQAAEERAARLSSPEALAEDSRSRLAFAGYKRDAAIGLAKRVFGIARPGWTPPQEQGSGRITGYVGEHLAQELLPDGRHVLVDSSLPLRSSVGDGQQRPVSLVLAGSGSGWAPANPLVPLSLGRTAGEGVSFASGLRMSPVGDAAPEAAEVVGGGVFYPGTAKDTDFMLEPRPLGVEASWQLLSAESSGENALSFSLPAGGRLVMSKSIEGAAEVLVEGQQQLLLMPASALEADGAELPVSYTVSGDTLITHVDLSGNVDFPVDVDPLAIQTYTDGFWAMWTKAESIKEVAEFRQGTGIEVELHQEAPAKQWADWGLFAPGYAAKEGSLMRVDISNIHHRYGGQSNLVAGILGAGGSLMPDAIHTYDGEDPADTESGLLETSAEIKNNEKAAAFCAEGGGGYDGGPTPLCNENVGGEFFTFTVDNWERHTATQGIYLESATARFLDTSNIKASVSSAQEINGTDNVFGGEGRWLGPNKGALEAIGSDPAFGVKRMTVNVAGKAVTHEYAAENDCVGILCGPEEHQALRYNNFPGGLPDGHDEIKVEAEDSSSLTAIWSSTVNVDNEKPYNLKVSGPDVKGETLNITEGPAGDQLTLEATDGADGVPSSGINRMGIWIDKNQYGQWKGSCSPGPCTAKATWALNGRELGAGAHSLIVKAIDGAENEETKSYTLVVHAAAPVAMGPGSVNPESGDFALESTDVSLKDGSGALAVTQHYDSRNVKEGAEGPLGPEWTIGLGQLSVLEAIESNGSLEGIVVVGAEGVWFFKPKGNGTFESPAEDSTLVLTQTGSEWKKAVFTLEDKKTGASTTFTKPGEANEWLPTVSTSAAASKTLTDSYTTVEIEGKKVVEPSEELAPHGAEKCPSNVKEMQEGCRALLFHYGNEHTEQPEASGEARSQWGWHAGRLTQVVAVAWNTSAKEMQEVPVAEFSYDKQGRLRAEWDPRIKQALKTIYGYDSENHVTAVSPPGQQPWLMTYGTTEGDASTGRLIKTMRPKASTTLWEGQEPENKEAPTITGTPTVGTRLAVSEGKWADSPLTYGYQWVRCNVHGQECDPIPGATNANYTPSTADLGATLEVEVRATNAGGTTSATTNATAEVTRAPFADHQESVDSPNALDSVSCLPETADCVIGDAKSNEVYSTNVSAKASASWTNWSGPGVGASHSLSCPGTGLCLLASGSGFEWSYDYATSLGGSWTRVTGVGSPLTVSCVSTSLCVSGLITGGVGYSTKPASESWSQTATGKAVMSSSACLPAGFCVIGDSGGTLHVAPSTSKIETGSWTETTIQSGRALVSVTCSSTSSCLAVNNTADVLALTINSSGTVTAIQPKEIDAGGDLAAVSCSKQTCVAVDSRGDLFVSINGGITWSAADTLGGDLTGVSCASPGLCLVIGNENRVTAVDPSEELRTEGAAKTPQSGTTIEYNVPVSGEGAPYAMGSKEVEAWGQKDDPAEASEIFPEEHPQGWPASGHTGASIDYLDDEANVVNVVAPNGAIATDEYENGRVVRALSPGNRARALKEANPAEAAEKLSTISKYNENGELAEVKGPEHKIKLASGEEVQARNHVQYFYDEGAPYNENGEPETYGLVTKSVDGAQLANGEERERRTTLTGYSGQEGVGWKLREPTSATTEPTGADLVSSTKYNKETGAVEETRTPGGNAETVSPPEPTSTFGSLGSGSGQFDDPEGVAFGPEGDVWVADEENDRIDRFTSTGVFVAKYGSAGGGQGAYREPNGLAINQKTGYVYIADTGNNKVQELNSEGKFIREWGKAGANTGEFEDPDAVAIDGAGNVWVSDWEDDRVQEFTETGTFIRQFGAKGTGDGEFEHITGLAFSQDMLYVVDTGNKRVQEFSTAGSEVRYTGQFGTPGGGSGEFEKPWGIAASPTTGDLYVSDEHDDDVLQFSPAGRFLEEFGGYGTGKGQLVDPKGLAVSATGSVYVTDRGNDRVSVWAPPEAGGAHMVFSTQLVSEGTGPGQFEYAAFMAIDGQGNVWVTDEDNHNVQVLSPQEKFIASYGSYGSGNGQFEKPTGVAINQAAKDVYIADCTANRIQELTTAGAFVRAFGSEGTGAGQLKCPQGLAIDGSGDVWVADRGNNRIEEFSATGSYIAAYGSAGTGNLQFKEPDDLAVSGGDIYVADTHNNRIQEISPEGHYLGGFGERTCETIRNDGTPALLEGVGGSS